MKRAMSGRSRKGSPPLPRQRSALRVVQLTFLALVATCVSLARDGWARNGRAALDGGSPQIGTLAVLMVFGLVGFVLVVWMGVRTVRGPVPPTLD